jgi:hypothetical protein
MTRVFSIEDVVSSILHEALDRRGYAGADMPSGLETVNELRNDFPEAKIGIISLSELLAAVQESVQSEDE